jgi:hypothetical protein
MDESPIAPPCKRLEERPARLTFGKLTEILFDSALEAVALAFLVQIMGKVVVGLVSGIWRNMTPSLPPVLAGEPAAEMATQSVLLAFIRSHQFAILFGLLFVGEGAGQLAHYSRNEDHRKTAAWLKRGLRRISEQWFSLVVVNAFNAFVAVFVLRIVQQFSLTHFLWGLVAHLFDPLIHGMARMLPGNGFMGLIEGLVAWYNSNQFKFTFWLFYSAAICDDLGLPNYKTLTRYVWRRLRGRGRLRSRRLAPPPVERIEE